MKAILIFVINTMLMGFYSSVRLEENMIPNETIKGYYIPMFVCAEETLRDKGVLQEGESLEDFLERGMKEAWPHVHFRVNPEQGRQRFKEAIKIVKENARMMNQKKIL